MELPRVDVDQWKSGVRGRSIGEFIAYKIQRQDATRRDMALAGTLKLLPDRVHQELHDYIVATSLFAHSPQFWQRDCVEFYDTTAKVLSSQFEKYGFRPDDQALFNAFEVVVLGLTRHIDRNPKIRAAAGICAPLPWGIIWLLLVVGALVYQCWIR